MRNVFFVVAIVVLIAAGASWEWHTGRVSTEEVIRVPSNGHQAKASAGSDTATHLTRLNEAAGSSLRSEAVTVALITLGGALLITAAFWDRIEELGFAGMTFKLLDPKLVRQVRDQAEDSDKALEAWELLLEKLRAAEKEGLRVSSEMTERAVGEALAEVSFNPEDSIVIDAEGSVEIDGDEIGAPALRVTTEEQYLSPGLFTDRFMAVLETSAEEENVQCLYALGVGMQEVVAALIFELPPGDAPIVLRALGARRVDQPELQSFCLGAALIGTRYLHGVASLQDRKPGLFIETDKPDQVELAALSELGFRVVAPDLEAGLQPSEYWAQYPPS